jgi:hypothetical protein
MSAPLRLTTRQREGAFRLSRRRRWAVYSAFALLLLTGVTWLALHFLDDASDAGLLAIAWTMKLHGAGAMVCLYLLGMLWGPHIRNAWVRKRNRLAGALFGAVTAVLVMTGYALYYVNGELPRQSAEYLHWAAGLIECLALWVHIHLGRRFRKVAAHA